MATNSIAFGKGEERLLANRDIPFLIPATSHLDSRGRLSKILDQESDFPLLLSQVFWSESRSGVVRGMHFSSDRNPGFKIVSVVAGEILDVLINLRTHNLIEPPIYNTLNKNSESIFIPQGFAHGFQVISKEPATVLYLSDNVYVPEYDLGINALECGIDWPLEIVDMSMRDRALPRLSSYLDS